MPEDLLLLFVFVLHSSYCRLLSVLPPPFPVSSLLPLLLFVLFHPPLSSLHPPPLFSFFLLPLLLFQTLDSTRTARMVSRRMREHCSLSGSSLTQMILKSRLSAGTQLMMISLQPRTDHVNILVDDFN